jgi:hypothetical protein
MEISVERIMQLLGEKEVEIILLKDRIKALEAALQNVQQRPPPPPE